MAWREVSAVGLRCEFCEWAVVEGANVSELQAIRDQPQDGLQVAGCVAGDGVEPGVGSRCGGCAYGGDDRPFSTAAWIAGAHGGVG